MTTILSDTAVVRMKLNAFWASQRPGKVVSVRELFQFGPDKLIYLVMSEFAKCQKVDRVAWGVYMLPKEDGLPPRVNEVVAAKARGFGKDIIKLNKEFRKSIVAKNGSDERDVIYATSGCSTSFRFQGKVVRLYKMANRKFELLKTKVGAAFVTLWKSRLDRRSDIKRVLKAHHVERSELRESVPLLHLLPLWLKNVMLSHCPEFKWRSAGASARASP